MVLMPGEGRSCSPSQDLADTRSGTTRSARCQATEEASNVTRRSKPDNATGLYVSRTETQAQAATEIRRSMSHRRSFTPVHPELVDLYKSAAVPPALFLNPYHTSLSEYMPNTAPEPGMAAISPRYSSAKSSRRSFLPLTQNRPSAR